MTFETNRVKAAEATQHHVVLKMLIASTTMTICGMALVFYLN